MFTLDSPATAKLQDVRVLVTKDRAPDTGVGAQLVFSKMSAPAQLLGQLAPALPAALFQPADNADQQQLEGMPAALQPTDIGEHVGWVRWSGEGTGYQLRIAFGIGGKSDIILLDCRLHRMKFRALESGGTEFGFCVDAPDVSPAVWGTLVSLKTQELDIKLLPPEVSDDEQMALDKLDGKKPAKKTAPPPAGTKPADWPFGQDGEPVVGAAERGQAEDDGEDHDPEEGRMGERDPGETDAPAEEPRRRRGKAAAAAEGATEAFVEAHAPRRRRGKGEAPATH